MPNIKKKDSALKLKNWYYAHRGFHDNKGDAPENSLKAFALAVELGYGVELDTQLTKDDVVVVFHDETLKRMCGITGNVRDYSYEELCKFKLLHSQEIIPTFAQVLDVINGNIPIIVEIKIYGQQIKVCELTNEILVGYQGLYCIESFHPLAVLWYKNNCPQIVRGQLSCNMIKKKDFQLPQIIVQSLISNFITKPDFIAYNHKDKKSISRKLCKNLYGNMSVAWTICSQEEMDICINDFDVFIFEGFNPK